MDQAKKRARYDRIRTQLAALLVRCEDPQARLATVLALLHHKMDHFFWTGCYGLLDGRLIVRMYQGPVACMELKADTGVCWAAIHRGIPVVVPDVAAFPGHIACDSRSRSDICVPIRDPAGTITGVLDIDSDRLGTFDQVDAEALPELLALIHRPD